MSYSNDIEKERPRILACREKHPDWCAKRISTATGVTVTAIKSILDGSDVSPPPPPEKPKPKVGISLDRFKQQFDPRVKIRKVISEFLAEGSILTDQQVRELCETNINDWRKFAELDEFKQYQWKWHGILYWATPSVIEQMKKTVGVL